MKNRGITLIALIITIIILLVLAGVAISAIISSNGILEKTNNAVGKYTEAAKNEANIFNQLLKNIPQNNENYCFNIVVDTTEIKSLPFTTKITAKNYEGTKITDKDLIYTIQANTEDYTLEGENITKKLIGGSKQEETFQITFTEIKTQSGNIQLAIEVTEPKVDKILKNIDVKVPDSAVFEYSYTGNFQTFTAPSNGVYSMELWGAQGGAANSSYPGYLGGYTYGEIFLKRDQKLYVYVGQEGQLAKGSWNGGGVSQNENGYPAKYGGGGATDIRTVADTWNNINSLRSRIMVAGGGGASTSYLRITTKVLGYGGGLVGGTTEDGYGRSGQGGTQTAGGTGAPGTYSGNGGTGSFGIGGTGVSHAWAGGGGGSRTSEADGAGGGGSSYISGHTGCVAITSNTDSSPKNNDITGTNNKESSVHYSGYQFMNSIMIDGAGYKWTNVREEYTGMPTWNGTLKMIGNNGNGYAKIRFIRY